MLPKTMKAAVVTEFGQPLKIEEMPVKAPNENQILVQVMASGVCHTDLHAADGDWPVKPRLPLIPGHEGIGYVAAVGSNVKNTKEGDIVGVPWLYSACGHCEHCITGWETLCESQVNGGYSIDGGFAEYVLADPNYVGRFSGTIDFVQMAPILCAGVTVYKGLKETEVRPGQWVAVSGIGGLGHVAVQYAKAMGLHVLAVDVADDKLNLAKKLGADMAVNGKNPDEVMNARKETGGVHGVLVTAVSPVAFRQALDLLRRKGTLVMNGLPPGSFDLPIFETVLNRYTVRGSIVGTRKDLQEAIDFAMEGKVTTTVKSAPLEDINLIFDQMKKGQIEGRMVLDIGH
ncbi:MAG TPA: alcohol dehydrogenase AdhP [Algoriphagus sp.]|jgi:propanol-preferring alcohol dehydrogenase|uniref:alcohol dehydrogenase n=1 Tax=Marivirga lumbricoides TaxID=1046115 RepID=A0ABQ1LYH3_9BACT|nr:MULTISPECIES: alcohol dehydrogenase AdhP [unclassified Algoriphagus]MEC7753755.1 alcohol dehydrogenase AdhP [Bacteroidota bacterium]GGC31984.1 zinc-dependent alcohol dehydrogenase [Marivirga lumbricoides]MAL14147.1 alcohol dehydrogenase AdhP [Algoriphagus sp.]MAN88391.1 alcohol dehydrogenase AdhP [Algoriphagus sp.]QYH39280.1 alcohol dehydrogenase AdhP [Algoriphagus sp. NBT04N3]|tara:strand:- start:11740 stop:12771 length:1032 start_codon:yes stop_codon:yes gene_type:complete